jgi:hypothetical protein
MDKMTLSLNISGELSAEKLAGILSDAKITPVIACDPPAKMTAEEFSAVELDDTGAPKLADKEPYGDVDYADPGYQEDKKKRYPLDTEAHIRAANSYIGQEKNQKQYSADQVSQIKSKIVSAWKSKIDKDGPPSAQASEIPAGSDSPNPSTTDATQLPAATLSAAATPPTLVNRGGIFWLLSDVLPSILEDGKTLYEIPIAVTGSWVKDGHRFSITEGDIDQIIENFDLRGNGMVVLDYEHASEQPEVAQGKAVPAAGWHRRLAKKIITSGGKALTALVSLMEFVPAALEMIQKGEYRFYSPAINWGKQNKETGKPVGAMLTSGALTNHPFLEELPAIVLSDMILSADVKLVSTQAVHVDSSTNSTAVDFENKGGTGKVAAGEKKMAKAKKAIKKIADGADAGKMGMYADDKLVKTFSKQMSDKLEAMDAAALSEMLDELDPVEPDEDDKTKPDAVAASAAPAPVPAVAASAAAPAAADAKLRESSAKKIAAVLFSETCIDGTTGGLDTAKVIELAASGQVTSAEAASATTLATEIEDLISKKSIFLPSQRKSATSWALRDEKGFREFCATAKPQVDLGTVGLNDTDTSGNSVQLRGVTSDTEKQVMQLAENRLAGERKHNPSYTFEQALNDVSRSNPTLWEKYRGATTNWEGRPGAKDVSNRVTF